MTGDLDGNRVYANDVISSSSRAVKNLNRAGLYDFFTVGHYYNLSGSVAVAGSGNNYDNLSTYCNVYFPTQDGEILICSRNGNSYWSPISIDFYYYGQDIGFIFDTTVVNYNTGFAYFQPVLKQQPDVPLVFTDLGVSTAEGEILSRIDENTVETRIDVAETKVTTKNILSSITEFFGSFFDNIINSFVRLFVPEDTYFADYFDRLNSFFEEKFGFLYQPIGFFVDIVNAFLGDWGDYSLIFPGFSWDGQEVWPDIEFSFDDTVSAFPKVFEYIRLATNISILVALINLIYRKYEEVMRN